MNWIRNGRHIPRIIITTFGAIVSLLGLFAGLLLGANVAYAQEATSTGPTTYSATVDIVNIIPEVSPITVPVIIPEQETSNTTTDTTSTSVEEVAPEVMLTPISIEITPTETIAVVTTSSDAASCPAVSSYLKAGWVNDNTQMVKLQDFLRDSEGASVASTGVFDETTVLAVKEFQEKYASEVLTPWGISVPTGFVYVTTKNKINEIACGTEIPLTQEELALMSKPRANSTAVAMTTDTKEADEPMVAAGTEMTIAEVNEDADTMHATETGSEMVKADDEDPDEMAMADEDEDTATSTGAVGEWGGRLAAALFAVPEDAQDLYKAGANIILILAVLAIAWLVLKEYVFYRKGLPKEERVNRTRLIFFAIGSLVASVAMAFSPTPSATLPLFALFVILLVMIFTQGVGMAPLAMQAETTKGNNNNTQRNNMVPMKTENRAPLSQKHGNEQQKNK